MRPTPLSALKAIPLALLVFAGASLRAGPPVPDDASSFAALRWRSIGPYRGGRVTAVAGVPGQPLVYYHGATGGGVWKTEDAGLSWHPISDGFFKTGSVGAIAVAPSDPNVIYVGMGEACLRGNLSSGDGVYKSTDAGRTWAHVGLDDTSQIGRIVVHPRNPDLVYVAAVGHPYGPNEQRGVFRSVDGGRSWRKILYVDQNTGAADLSMDATNPRIIFATTWQVRRAPWGIESGGPGSGMYKTTDGGDRWTLLTEGLPRSDKGKIGVAVSPVNPDRVWAVVPAGPGHEEGGVFRSDDGGRTWRMTSNPPESRLRDYYYGHIYADTQDANTVYTFRKEFLKSIDGGGTWQELRLPHADFHALWIDPADSRRMINGNDGGATITLDGGASWSTIDNQPTGQFYAVVADHQFPYRLYGSQQDNTTVSIPSRASGGIDASDWDPVGGGESGHIAPDPSDPNVAYGGSYFGKLTRYDHRTAEARDISIWPDYNGGRTAAEMKYRFQWTFPIVASMHEPGVIYAGANVLFRSSNQGQRWEAVSPDLTRDDKEKQRGGRLEEYYGTIFAIAESPRERGVIWTGSDDGLVHLTRNGGKDWQNVTPSAMAPWTRVNAIETSPHDAGTAYVAANRYQMDDDKPFIYTTLDYGKTWKVIGRGIPDRSFVRSVREDPKRRGLLFAGTETGVYVSFDAGESWRSLQLNLPVVPITDLRVKDGDLVAATQGRGFWILDDITPLEQSTDAVTTSSVHLFRPREAHRIRQEGGFGRGQGPVGQNPPGGVAVSYYLREKPSTPIAIEFADAAGQTIASFTSGEGHGVSGGRRPPAEAAGRPQVTADIGLNRFHWDMRYPGARGIDGGTFLAGGRLRGPMALPGAYRVTLKAGGQTLGQTFEIRKDAASSAADQDLRKQFDFLIAVRDRVSAAHDAVNAIKAVQKDVDETVGRAKRFERGGEIAAAGEKLKTALSLVLHELYEPRYIGYDDQMLIFPLKLNVRLAALQGYVDGPDAPPTDQAEAVFKELSAELDRQLARLAKSLETDVPAFNKLVQEVGLPAIAPGRSR